MADTVRNQRGSCGAKLGRAMSRGQKDLMYAVQRKSGVGRRSWRSGFVVCRGVRECLALSLGQNVGFRSKPGAKVSFSVLFLQGGIRNTKCRMSDIVAMSRVLFPR